MSETHECLEYAGHVPGDQCEFVDNTTVNPETGCVEEVTCTNPGSIRFRIILPRRVSPWETRCTSHLPHDPERGQVPD